MTWEQGLEEIESELRCVRSRLRFCRFGIFNRQFWLNEEQRLIRNRNDWLLLKESQ